jgi:hypothetical protein
MKSGREIPGEFRPGRPTKNIENNPMQSSRATGVTACGFSEKI